MKKYLLVVILMVATFCFSKPKLNLDYTLYVGNVQSLPKYSNNMRLYFNDDIFVGDNIIVYKDKCINNMYIGHISSGIENILGYDKDLYYQLNISYNNIYAKNKIWLNGYYNGEYEVLFEKGIFNARIGIFVQKIKALQLTPIGHIGIKLKIYENKNFNVKLNSSLEFIRNKATLKTYINIVVR